MTKIKKQVSKGSCSTCNRLFILLALVLQVVIITEGFYGGSLFGCTDEESADDFDDTVVVSTSPTTTIERKKSALAIPEIDSDWSALGVAPRAFSKWKGPFPCFAPEPNWFNSQIQRSPSYTGILYVKEMKTGSSTLSGVTLRIAKQVALRTTGYKICKARFDHSLAVDLDYKQRIRSKSFLFTVIRHPTKRATSQFFHFKVSREKKEPTDVNFKKYLEHPLFDNYYFKSLSMLRSQMGIISENPPKRKDDSNDKKPKKGYAFTAAAVTNQILSDYNFIGITERMDESIVALAMLLDLELTDVLYLTAKGSGGYDDGRYNQTCFYIVPAYVSPTMKEYFASPEWKERVEGDELLYKAAYKSLDMTIDALGRDLFDSKLVEFKRARALAEETCAAKVQYPCNADGSRQPRAPGCLWNDSGCGNECLDKVAKLLKPGAGTWLEGT
jgi:hypothetical protein